MSKLCCAVVCCHLALLFLGLGPGAAAAHPDASCAISAIEPGQAPAAYSYDSAGNRTSARQGAATTAFAQDKADRLTAVGPYTATSDADGNLTGLSGNGITETFAYDQANRLVGATANGVTTTYAYDGDGVRVGQTVNGTTTSYVDDTNRALPVILTEGTTKDVWGPAGLAERVDSQGNVQVPLADGLGSVRAVTDGAGNVVQTYLTDAFGNPANPPGSQGTASQPFGFTGQPQGGDGLVYLRGRSYAPSLGRFLQRDPAAGNVADPLSLNRSTYVRNNPTTLTDPSGRTPTNKALASDDTCNNPLGKLYCGIVNPILGLGGMLSMLPGIYHGQGEGGGGSGSRAPEDVPLKDRVTQLHSLLNPIAARMRTTAIVRAVTPEGQVVDIVASSEGSLTPAQRAALGPNELAASGPGHAQVTALRYAEQLGYIPRQVAASRPICASCAQAIKAAGAIPIGPVAGS